MDALTNADWYAGISDPLRQAEAELAVRLGMLRWVVVKLETGEAVRALRPPKTWLRAGSTARVWWAAAGRGDEEAPLAPDWWDGPDLGDNWEAMGEVVKAMAERGWGWSCRGFYGHRFLAQFERADSEDAFEAVGEDAPTATVVAALGALRQYG